MPNYATHKGFTRVKILGVLAVVAIVGVTCHALQAHLNPNRAIKVIFCGGKDVRQQFTPKQD